MNSSIEPQARIDFAIVGSGWRSEFFLRIARELPDRFRVVGLVTRSETTGRAIQESWGVPTFATIDQLVRHTKPTFAVVSVPRQVAPETITRLAGHGILTLVRVDGRPHDVSVGHESSSIRFRWVPGLGTTPDESRIPRFLLQV